MHPTSSSFDFQGIIGLWKNFKEKNFRLVNLKWNLLYWSRYSCAVRIWTEDLLWTSFLVFLLSFHCFRKNRRLRFKPHWTIVLKKMTVLSCEIIIFLIWSSYSHYQLLKYSYVLMIVLHLWFHSSILNFDAIYLIQSLLLQIHILNLQDWFCELNRFRCSRRTLD